MKIQILGSGCSKCAALEKNARLAVNELGLQAEIEKITDIQEILAFGVMSTPALGIDGEIKSVGRVLSKDQISAFLKPKL